MVYDKANRLVETIFPDATPDDLSDNPRTINTYDDAGRLVAVQDERGNTTRYEYDAAGQRTKTTNALDQETVFEYDLRGNRIKVTDVNGHETRFEYDLAGRLVKTIYHDDTYTETGYDKLGRKEWQTDQAGVRTDYEYDANGNLTAVIDDLGQRTEYGYDLHGNKVSQTDANNHATKWTYDNIGRVIGRELPEGQTESYTHDAAGNRRTRTDFNGETTTYDYDKLNRLVRTLYPDGSEVTQTYTATGQVESITDARGTTEYDYDERDRLVRLTHPSGEAIEYRYDAAGNRSAVITRVSHVAYTFDALNRLKDVLECAPTVTECIDANATAITTYGYDAVGNRASIEHADGSTTGYDYDALNRLTELTNLDATGAIISQHTYTLNDTGHRERLDEHSGRSVTFSYDRLYRLTQETVTDPVLGNRTTTYTFDKTGNRQSRTVTCSPACSGEVEAGVTTYSYDKNDRLLSETGPQGTTTYAYDDNGNTVSESGPGGTTTYSYDYENRLIGATTPGATLAYSYDQDNIRHSQTVNGSTTTFLVDPNRDYHQVLAEFDEQGSVLDAYTYGDDLLALQSSEGRFTYHYDGLGSTRALSQGGFATDSYTYEAYGELEGSSGTTVNDYLYAGEQFDGELDQYYLRQRYYDQGTGRFGRMDEYAGRMMEPATLHKYVYVHGDPANGVDPSGYATLAKTGVVLNGVGVLVNITTYSVNILTGNYVGLAESIVTDAASMLFPGGWAAKHARNLAAWNFRTRRFKVGLAASGDVLRHNMEAFGLSKCGGCAAHHIIPGTDSRFASAIEARRIIDGHGVDINSFVNGVFLPTRRSATTSPAAPHIGGHNEAYYADVLRTLRAFNADAPGNKDGLYRALEDIRERLLSGELRLNNVDY
jgi:RHS repeat-associated protein